MPMSRSEKLKRRAVNVFIAVLMVVFTIDGMPGLLRFHVFLQSKTDPILKAMGLWQGAWDLFAPSPDKLNIRLSAEVHYGDGSVFRWRSPDWRDKPRWYLLRHYRRQEYYDNVRMDVNRAAWPGLARHVLQLAEEQQATGPGPVRVALTRYWWTVPEVRTGFVLTTNINQPMNAYLFHLEVFPEMPGAQ